MPVFSTLSLRVLKSYVVINVLSDRRQIILRALIEEYILRAAPVGSKTIVDNYDVDVSSATVRNDLNFLEECGLITQPHTSAGRIPTEAGYREFVDFIFDNEFEDTDEEEFEPYLSDIRRSADEIDEMLEEISIRLAGITHNLSIISSNRERPKHAYISKRGISSMMKQPEFKESANLLPLMEILEDDTVLYRVLSATNQGDSLQVKIGHENKTHNLNGVSVVTACFGDDSDGGVVAVIGPTRMNYENVIKAVLQAQSVLNEIEK
jgi:transcriptional regulator of heat shock response